MKNEELRDDSQTGAGWLRRDALKAAVLLASPLAAQTRGVASGPLSAVLSGQRNQPFDEGWRFLRGDAPGAEAPREIRFDWSLG
jgi:hypothetical protein